MKLMLPIVLTLLATSPLAYAAEKLCVGTAGEFRGYEIRLTTAKDKLVVHSMPSNRGYIAYAGEYEFDRRTRTSRDGHPQTAFAGYEEGGYNLFWLDSSLLDAGAEGFLDVTTIDEGRLTVRFACKEFR